MFADVFAAVAEAAAASALFCAAASVLVISSPCISSSDITIYELTPEERQAFQEASEPVYEIFGKEIGVDLLNRVREFLADPANQ